MSDIVEFPDRETLTEALAARLADDLRGVIAAKGRAVFCVSGGSSPPPVFRALSGMALDWGRVTVVLNDERWVPADHDRSNARMVHETLLQGPAAAADFVPLYHPVPTPEEGMPAVTAAVQAHALPLDVLLLGMGEDAHTASLFPGADRLAEALDPTCTAPVLAMRAPGAGEPRITLTLPALLTASTTHLLITGAKKRAVLAMAMEDGPEADAPIRAILRRAAPIIHYAP